MKQITLENGQVIKLIKRPIKENDWVYCSKKEAVTDEDRIYQVDKFDYNRQSHVILGKDGIWYSLSYGCPILSSCNPQLEGTELLKL